MSLHAYSLEDRRRSGSGIGSSIDDRLLVQHSKDDGDDDVLLQSASMRCSTAWAISAPNRLALTSMPSHCVL